MVLGLTTPTVLPPFGQVSRFKLRSVYLHIGLCLVFKHHTQSKKSMVPCRVVLGDRAHMHQQCFWTMNAFVEVLLSLTLVVTDTDRDK